MKKKLVFVLLSSVLVLSTCTKDRSGTVGCFQEEVLPIFISNCTMSGCHNSKDKADGYDLSNYDGIMKGIKPRHPLQSEIYKVIRGNNPSMPQGPYPKLSQADVSMIKLWINMGALNTSNCKSCDTLNYSYSGKIKGIMQTWCTGCHNAGSSGGGYDLSTYNGLIQAIPNNKLSGSINHFAGFSAMPQSGGKLSDCDIAAIEKWIAAGHPDN